MSNELIDNIKDPELRDRSSSSSSLLVIIYEEHDSLMIQYKEKQLSSVRKRKREPVTDNPVEENANTEENFLICQDCRHNSIRYDPSKHGACDCGCH